MQALTAQAARMATGRSSSTQKHTILFLAANPEGTDRGALDHEARAIELELRRSVFRHRFELVTCWAAEPLDLLRKLRELNPTVVHFAGHGAPDGLSFHGANGHRQSVAPQAIAEAIRAAGASVKLVVLNACFTEAAADALLPTVDCVVGMSGSIHAAAARIFAIGFYGGLGEQASVAAAFSQGRAAINLEGLIDAERPKLKVRDGFDAAQLNLATPQPSVPAAVRCPYPGMRPFTAEDVASFHGREAEIGELIGRLRANEREIFVIGPSGSGKSSLVAAGLLPRLARGLSGLGPFVVRELRPGDRPLSRLRQALDAPPGEPLAAAERVAALLVHRAPGTSVLIIVDQLEELFTQASAGERTAFLDAVGAMRTELRCVVIFTLRADFSEALMESPLWPERPAQISRVDVSPLRGKGLCCAIAAPAEGVGVAVQPELIERLVADAASEPGSLPFLQETMVQLWDGRRDHTLALADYEALGVRDRNGLAVALSRRADATLHALSNEEQVIARRIFLRLISFGDGRSDTRRQQPRSKLRAVDDEPSVFDAVLRRLIADRLLTTDDVGDGGDARVDLAHEVMIAAWPALTDWLRIHGADERRRRQLEAAAAKWVEQGRGERGLLDSIELADAKTWLDDKVARELGVSADVTALVVASRAAQVKHEEARAREAEARRGRIRRIVWAAGVGIIVLLAVIAATAISVARAQEQELQRDVLRTNAYAAHALAGAVAFHLREQMDAVVATASDADVARLLHGGDREALERRRIQSPFETIALYDRSGTLRVHAPGVSRVVGKDYSWRDYFRGVLPLGQAGLRAGYISRALHSEDDDLYKFGIAAPIYDGDAWVGVLMATIGTDFALKRKRLDPTSEAGPMAVVVAPRDRSRDTTKGEGEYVVLLHEGLPHGAEIVVDSPRLRELRVTRTEHNQLRWLDSEPITDDAHRDPVPGFEGRWLAGFAPVGDTGFVVIVQTRYNVAVEPNARLSRRLASRTAIVLLAWIALSAAGVWLYLRRRPNSRSAPR